MTTAIERAQALTPEAMPVKEIPSDLEITVELITAAHGNYKSKLAGRLDDAGTVRATVYVPDGYKGKAFTMREADLRPSTGDRRRDGVVVSADRKVIKWTYEADDRIVVLYTPAAAAAPESVTINF